MISEALSIAFKADLDLFSCEEFIIKARSSEKNNTYRH